MLHIRLIAGIQCEHGSHLVSDLCVYRSDSTVESSNLCGEVCGDDMPAEIYSVSQGDAIRDGIASGVFGSCFLGMYPYSGAILSLGSWTHMKLG